MSLGSNFISVVQILGRREEKKNVLDIVKNYWEKFKKFGPSQKILRPLWCAKLITGLEIALHKITGWIHPCPM